MTLGATAKSVNAPAPCQTVPAVRVGKERVSAMDDDRYPLFRLDQPNHGP
jgi:hypothetical protein